MKVAIIGSRSLTIEDFAPYLPQQTSEIVSGGARGIERCARRYAEKNQIPITEFLPEYALYGRSAPIRRNLKIIAYCDLVIAFWDGASNGTRFVIDCCKKQGKPIRIYLKK